MLCQWHWVVLLSIIFLQLNLSLESTKVIAGLVWLTEATFTLGVGALLLIYWVRKVTTALKSFFYLSGCALTVATAVDNHNLCSLEYCILFVKGSDKLDYYTCSLKSWKNQAIAMSPPLELTWVWKYSKGRTINIMILVFWLIILLIVTTVISLFWCAIHAIISNLFLAFEQILCIFLYVYLSQHMYTSPSPVP